MKTLQKLSSSPRHAVNLRWCLGAPRQASEPLARLSCMSTQDTISTDAEDASLLAIVCLSELAAHLRVSIQTLYDLRSQGRGPRGFRVGRELRFRRTEIETWLARLEDADRDRHPAQERAS